MFFSPEYVHCGRNNGHPSSKNFEHTIKQRKIGAAHLILEHKGISSNLQILKDNGAESDL